MYDLRENGKYDPSVFNGVTINKKDFDKTNKAFQSIDSEISSSIVK